MHVPKWAIALNLIAVALLAMWATALSSGKNPLPWPDRGSRIFSAASPEGKAAMVELLARHGVEERFKADSGGVLRSIMWDGTIINFSPPEITGRIGGVTSAVGLVSDDPLGSAREAAAFLRTRGFRAEVVDEIEPGLPIAFVVTDAMAGTAINFRPPISKMPAPE